MLCNNNAISSRQSVFSGKQRTAVYPGKQESGMVMLLSSLRRGRTSDNDLKRDGTVLRTKKNKVVTDPLVVIEMFHAQLVVHTERLLIKPAGQPHQHCGQCGRLDAITCSKANQINMGNIKSSHSYGDF